MGFLLSELKQASCRRLGEVMSISHDSVNRFLHREAYKGRDLYNEARLSLNLKGGNLSVDDSVLDKPYSQYRRWSVIFGQASITGPLKASILSLCTTPIVKGNTNPLTFG
jgi:hypothetical protein